MVFTPALSGQANVLIRGNRIERISSAPIAADPSVTVIAGNGRTLMPGLVENPARNFVAIMKDGTICKNLVGAGK
jgi:dihydroorotase-like cyclic amidohydrolase